MAAFDREKPVVTANKELLARHGRELEEAERRVIAAALRQARGNKNEAARLLQIDRQRLYRKIEKYGL